jgi:NAD(P)H-dependent flavin oxidoreductase YrpB (nitropropane dioxygenase family)
VSARTELCDLLGITHPVVQAPVGEAAGPNLAAAVSEAGALGMLSLSWRNDVAAVVRDTAALSGRPFGGNLVLAWDQHARLDAALEAGLRIASLTWGDPTAYVARAHDAGALVMHTVGTAEEARRAVAAGVDVVVAQGWEAGGHVWGAIATLPLVPAVVDAVAPVPVIAAGGIGDARGVAAVLALGAQAAWLGTRFLLAREAPVHPEYRRCLRDAAETDAQWYRDLYDVEWPDAPHRALKNSTAAAWEAAGRPAPGDRPGEGETIARAPDGESVVRYSSTTALEGMTGDISGLSLWAGQSVALANRTQTAAEIVAELVSRL